MSNPHQLAVLLYGAGGHGAVVEAAILAGEDYYVAGVFDDDERLVGKRLIHAVVQGGREMLEVYLREGICRAHVGIGGNEARRKVSGVLKVLGCELVTVVHPRGWVERGAEVGDGSFVAAGAVIGARTRVGRGVIVNTGATVDHDCVVGDFAHVCPGAHVAGGVEVGEEAMIGTGAAIIPGVKIGARAVVGAGAVVIRDVPEGVVVVGNPARELRQG